ncbi:MAG: membrane dipeptidase [Bacteroidales bacterium]|nr:membrane dipeptidase [Bacteroidales bacterium]
MFLLDSHCDAPTMLLKGADFSKNVPAGHVDYQRMRKGGVDASFFAIYTSAELAPDAATRRALEMIAAVKDSVAAASAKVALATTPAEALKNKKNGKISIFMGMENGAPIQQSLSLLRLFHGMGITYMTLCHNGNNEICDAAATAEKRWGGISPFGSQVIEEMNRIGMMIDVSHISDMAFYDVLSKSKAPVVATHSCCRAICDHYRNMSDEMIEALAERGGVIQINFYPAFLDNNYKSMNPSYKRIVDHIDHVVNLVGVEHVGIGSDFDGIEITPEGMEDVSKMQKLTIEMRKRGYSDHEIALIEGGNFLRIMEKVQNI